jgi:hypothetical protein
MIVTIATFEETGEQLEEGMLHVRDEVAHRRLGGS